MIINLQQEEEKSSDGEVMFQLFQEDQEKGQKTPEELFLEHFTAEPVRDEVLEETTSDQVVTTTLVRPPQEQWRDLEIVEDDRVSAENGPSRRGSRRGRSATSSEETRSTNSSDRRSGRIRKQTQLFDVNQFARSMVTPRSRTGPISLKSTKSVFKNVVQTAKRELKNCLSGTPGLVRRERTVSGERDRTG